MVIPSRSVWFDIYIMQYTVSPVQVSDITDWQYVSEVCELVCVDIIILCTCMTIILFIIVIQQLYTQLYYSSSELNCYAHQTSNYTCIRIQ